MASEWATSHGLDLLLELDQAGGRRAALIGSLQRAIRDGRLSPGARLPSSRVLAADIGVARGTVADAYDQLVAEGWLAARRGSGTAVAWTPPRPGRTRRAASTADDGPDDTGADEPAPPFDFRPGSPDVSMFPRQDWAAAVRRALRDLPDADLRYGDPRGLAVAREVLAGYLARTRGVRTDPTRIMITTGFSQALALLADALVDLGATGIAVEDPCIPAYRTVVTRAGLRVHPLVVGTDGADPSSLSVSDMRVGAALLTPAHQYPMGTTLAPSRRTAFTEWARGAGAYVIEDDYDGEFRYDRQPVGALQAMDPERVVYIGTASKSLAPALRLGWVVVPPALLDAVVAAKERSDRQTGVIDQMALAEMIRSGALDRHVRRCRLGYRARRDALVESLGSLRDVSAGGIAAGLHAVLALTAAGADEDEVVDRLGAAGVAVHGLGEYWHGRPGLKGLVVGFGTPPAHAFPAALAALIAALR